MTSRSHPHFRSAALTLVAVSLTATGISATATPARGVAPEPAHSGLTGAMRGAGPVASAPAALPLPIPFPLPGAGAEPEPEPEVEVKGRSEPERNGLAKRLPLGPKDLEEKRSVRTLAKGVTLTVVHRGEGLGPRKGIDAATNGPWVVRALTIDPKVAEGHLATTYGPSVAGTTPTTELTRRADALAGVNASFFDLGSRLPGNPVGLTVARGRVLSEPTGMRSEVTLLVDSKRNELRIDRLRWTGQLRDEDGKRVLRLDKVNAVPRTPAACRRARTMATCTRTGQIAAFTAEFGKRTPRGPGLEVLLDRDGCAVKVASHRGMRLGKGRSSIQATGASARRVRALVKDGCVDIRHTVRDAKGRPVELNRSTAAVSGRFRLLDEGRIVAPTGRRHSFFARHPRTLAGTTWDGKIVLATIDGRSRRSVGATLREAAKVAWALGMRDAVNLDGGGSTTMSVRGKLANRVSGKRERAVSDALIWRRD